jgi:hypothetical protein
MSKSKPYYFKTAVVTDNSKYDTLKIGDIVSVKFVGYQPDLFESEDVEYYSVSKTMEHNQNMILSNKQLTNFIL